MFGDQRVRALAVRVRVHVVRGASELPGASVRLPAALALFRLVAPRDGDRPPPPHNGCRLSHTDVPLTHQSVSTSIFSDKIWPISVLSDICQNN